MKMKYIAFWEFNPEDYDKAIEKEKQAMEERERGTDKFPKILFPSHGMGGEFKGFIIYEDATPEQLINVGLHYMPETKFKFVPIFDGKKVLELYQKVKK